MEARYEAAYSIYSGEIGHVKVPAVVVVDENGDECLMAYVYRTGKKKWTCRCWETTDAGEEVDPPSNVHFDSHNEAMDFLTMRLVLARML